LFLLKRYARANNPAIANITSNLGIAFSSSVGNSVAVVVGDSVGIGIGVREREFLLALVLLSV